MVSQCHHQYLLKILKLRAWHAFKWIFSNFLGNFKSPSYKEGVAELLAPYKEMGCCMILKIQFLILTLSFFLKILKQAVVRDFTKISKQKKSIKDFGKRMQWVIFAGCCTVMIPLIYTNGTRIQKNFKIFFLELVLNAVLNGAQVKSNHFAMVFLNSLFQSYPKELF